MSGVRPPVSRRAVLAPWPKSVRTTSSWYPRHAASVCADTLQPVVLSMPAVRYVANCSAVYPQGAPGKITDVSTPACHPSVLPCVVAKASCKPLASPFAIAWIRRLMLATASVRSLMTS
jgi:hypothetical protein